MQNIWMTGLILASMIGSGAAVGYGLMNDYGGMHYGMHDSSYEDCDYHENCDYEHEECDEHYEEECVYEHKECYDKEHRRGRGC